VKWDEKLRDSKPLPLVEQIFGLYLRRRGVDGRAKPGHDDSRRTHVKGKHLLSENRKLCYSPFRHDDSHQQPSASTRRKPSSAASSTTELVVAALGAKRKNARGVGASL
jgi:hypothetical protein